MDEGEQINLVMASHRRAGTELPNPLLHATIHVVVENQIALGDENPVQSTLARLQREGLDRDDAVHAIGSILAGYMYDLVRGPAPSGDPNAAYYQRLESLTAREWRAPAE
jgi:hypothetical protein